MTKKEEPRGESMDSQSVSPTMLVAVAVVMLAVGLIGGYYVLGTYMPMETETVSNGGTSAQTEEFVYNEAKINEITETFGDYFYVYSQGQDVEFSYDSYIEMDNYVKLIYVLDGQEFDIYMSKDYKELYPSVLTYDEFKSEVESAKAQFEAMPEETEEPAELEKTDEPEVLLFVMSFCPYGNVAEDAMYPVVDSIGESMYFEPVYIVSGGPGAWSSLHGNVELNQDVREKIIYNLYGPDVWMDYVYDVNQKCDYTNADTCWKDPAETMGINTTEVEELFNNQTYVDELLMKDASITSAYGVSGSPTLIINGMKMSIARTPEAYKQAICDADLTPDENCTVELAADSAAPEGSCG